MTRQGLFIALEGPEGAGKSTNREFIGKFLEDAGIKVIYTREPGGTPLAERIREILLTPLDEQMHSKTELLLMSAQRAQHVEQVVKPHMEAGAVVLCDRFIDSTYAYQCHGRKVPRHEIDHLVNYTLGDFRPNLTFMFDIPYEIGMQRVAARGQPDRFELEGHAFFARVATGYRDQVNRNPGAYALINANQPMEQVQAQIVPHLQSIVNYLHRRIDPDQSKEVTA